MAPPVQWMRKQPQVNMKLICSAFLMHEVLCSLAYYAANIQVACAHLNKPRDFMAISKQAESFPIRLHSDGFIAVFIAEHSMVRSHDFKFQIDCPSYTTNI